VPKSNHSENALSSSSYLLTGMENQEESMGDLLSMEFLGKPWNSSILVEVSVIIMHDIYIKGYIE
jgi:hypothetical protein